VDFCVASFYNLEGLVSLFTSQMIKIDIYTVIKTSNPGYSGMIKNLLTVLLSLGWSRVVQSV
jgi:hypothetical protein